MFISYNGLTRHTLSSNPMTRYSLYLRPYVSYFFWAYCYNIMNRSIINHSKFSSDTFYSMPVSTVDVTCARAAYSIVDIAEFIKAINFLYKLDTTKQRVINSITKVIVLHYVLLSIHDSRFIDYCVSNNKTNNVPEFIHSWLAKLITRVESRNKMTGWVNGQLLPADDILIKPTCITHMDEEVLRTILNDLGYSSLSSDFYVKEIKNNLVRVIDSFDYDNTEALFDSFLSFLSDAPFMFRADSLPMRRLDLNLSVSQFFGIYRFRNSLEDGCYLVAQTSCHTLRDGLLNLFACFLRLNSPQYVDHLGMPLAHGLVAGDAVLNVSEVPIKDVWIFYLSSVVGERASSTKPTRNRRRNKQSTSGQLLNNLNNNEQVIEGNSNQSKSYSTGLSYDSNGDYFEDTLFPTQVILHDCESRVPLIYLFREPSSKLFKLARYVDD